MKKLAEPIFSRGYENTGTTLHKTWHRTPFGSNHRFLKAKFHKVLFIQKKKFPRQSEGNQLNSGKVVLKSQFHLDLLKITWRRKIINEKINK